MENDILKFPLALEENKKRALPLLMEKLPKDITTCFDVFAGGGNVGLNTQAHTVVLNEKNAVLASILSWLSKVSGEEALKEIDAVIEEHSLSQCYKKKMSSDEMQASYEAVLGLRKSVNEKILDRNRNDVRGLLPYRLTAELFTLICFSYSHQLSFNALGLYNSPPALSRKDGAFHHTFNKRMRKETLSFCAICKGKDVHVYNMDALQLMSDVDDGTFEIKADPATSLFFIDPPYQASVTKYNKGWSERDDIMLLMFCDILDRKGIRYAMTNFLSRKGRENEMLVKWLSRKGSSVCVTDMKQKHQGASNHAKDDYKVSEILMTNFEV